MTVEYLETAVPLPELFEWQQYFAEKSEQAERDAKQEATRAAGRRPGR